MDSARIPRRRQSGKDRGPIRRTVRRRRDGDRDFRHRGQIDRPSLRRPGGGGRAQVEIHCRRGRRAEGRKCKLHRHCLSAQNALRQESGEISALSAPAASHQAPQGNISAQSRLPGGNRRPRLLRLGDNAILRQRKGSGRRSHNPRDDACGVCGAGARRSRSKPIRAGPPGAPGQARKHAAGRGNLIGSLRSCGRASYSSPARPAKR